MKRSIVLNVLLFLAVAVSPACLPAGMAFAESKSATVHVSCTISPMIQMGLEGLSTASPRVDALSTLDKRYQMTEHMQDRSGHKIKIYSLTAL